MTSILLRASLHVPAIYFVTMCAACTSAPANESKASSVASSVGSVDVSGQRKYAYRSLVIAGNDPSDPVGFERHDEVILSSSHEEVGSLHFDYFDEGGDSFFAYDSWGTLRETPRGTFFSPGGSAVFALRKDSCGNEFEDIYHNAPAGHLGPLVAEVVIHVEHTRLTDSGIDYCDGIRALDAHSWVQVRVDLRSPLPLEACDNALDDDEDGRVDCDDPECTCDSDPPGEICDNGVDDDDDGHIDCDDTDCAGISPCLAPEICDGGIDEDGDGFADCEDPDCEGSPECQ